MQESGHENSMKIGLPESLRAAVQQKFKQARISRDLLFSDTELSVLRTFQFGRPAFTHSCVKFQLRYCPALGQKPKDNVADSSKQAGHQKPKTDPFENPSAELLVGEVPKGEASHILVLNKYPVICNHFILATKDNKPQTGLLEEDDLSISYACLNAWQQDSHRQNKNLLFAFFNSGEHSGASQPHRHLQFLPVEDMMPSQLVNSDWRVLTEGMTAKAHPSLPLLYDPAIPFVHFATSIEPNPTPQSLHSKYILLLKAALSATTTTTTTGSINHPHLFNYNPQARISTPSRTTTLSYNLAMTVDKLAICPRRAESVAVPDGGADSSVAINGTILGGTLMVKDQQEWDALKDNPHALDDMLAGIGFAWPATKGGGGLAAVGDGGPPSATTRL